MNSIRLAKLTHVFKSPFGPRFHAGVGWVNRKVAFFAVAAIGAWFPEAADTKSTGDLIAFYKDYAWALLPWTGGPR
jgi:hypothetical protein